MLYLDMFMAMFIFKLSTSMFRPVETLPVGVDSWPPERCRLRRRRLRPWFFRWKIPGRWWEDWEDWGEVIGMVYICLLIGDSTKKIKLLRWSCLRLKWHTNSYHGFFNLCLSIPFIQIKKLEPMVRSHRSVWLSAELCTTKLLGGATAWRTAMPQRDSRRLRCVLHPSLIAIHKNKSTSIISLLLALVFHQLIRPIVLIMI